MTSSIVLDSGPEAGMPYPNYKLGDAQSNCTLVRTDIETYPEPKDQSQERHGFGHVESQQTLGSRDPNAQAFLYNASLHPVDTSTSQALPAIASHRASPLSAELRVQTNLWGPENSKIMTSTAEEKVVETYRQEIPSISSLSVRTPSIKSALAAANYTGDSLSPSSVISSPGVGPLADITPLPSPIGAGTSPETWRAIAGLSPISPPSSTSSSEANDQISETSFRPARSPSKKRKAYQSLNSATSSAQAYDPRIATANAASHARNRSLSEYVPDIVSVPRTRNIAVSGQFAPTVVESQPPKPLHREEYLAVQRGISGSARPPTPPRSTKSIASSNDLESPSASPRPNEGPLPLLYEARDIKSGIVKRWFGIRQLGKGTFSTVMLATSEEKLDADHFPKSEEQFNPRSLVAVKICEHGPAGGADEKKIESSLKRELDILKAIDHPSLVHLQAVSVLDKRAFLVLNYSAGGDLFELASLQLDLLVPPLIRRIFAELVAAVRYLHEQYIVHRDIKLENVLVNLPTTAISTITNWRTYPHPIITLTDLGLGRWIPKPPESPLLDTRCGSEDYAAPELLMGQDYDGRATDAWALGVLLYAMMEGRLPFDPIPGARRQSPTSHRIARCEWSWVKWADDNGEWDALKGKELEGAKNCVEGLLKRSRSRWGLDAVSEKDWVRQGLVVEGGLKRDRAEDEEI
ncbi:hypothetical protein MMC13_003930 [Lambiella insularis]|nr:hypothetical protein [Lambiella insularis]